MKVNKRSLSRKAICRFCCTNMDKDSTAVEFAHVVIAGKVLNIFFHESCFNEMTEGLKDEWTTITKPIGIDLDRPWVKLKYNL